ncbi:MAG: nuclear transport factor 2 family protein [Actinomycetota bacterium]
MAGIDALVAAHFAAVRALDVEAWVSTFASDGVRYDPGRTTSGHHALRRFFEGLIVAFENFSITEERVFTDGNRAAVRWTGRGRGHQGREVSLDGIDVFEFDSSGKIAVLRTYWDADSLLDQLQGAANA